MSYPIEDFETHGYLFRDFDLQNNLQAAERPYGLFTKLWNPMLPRIQDSGSSWQRTYSGRHTKTMQWVMNKYCQLASGWISVDADLRETPYPGPPF